jgi:hypothetical protein
VWQPNERYLLQRDNRWILQEANQVLDNQGIAVNAANIQRQDIADSHK